MHKKAIFKALKRLHQALLRLSQALLRSEVEPYRHVGDVGDLFRGAKVGKFHDALVRVENVGRLDVAVADLLREVGQELQED